MSRVTASWISYTYTCIRSFFRFFSHIGNIYVSLNLSIHPSSLIFKTWTEKIHRYQRSTWEDDQHHYSLRKHKLKPRDTTNAYEMITDFLKPNNAKCLHKYGIIGTLPGGSVVKNPPANAEDTRDMGLILGSGRSPGEGNGNPFHYSCLDNPVDRGAWGL